MMDRDQASGFERLLAPYALFLGAALSFLACCFGGYVVSGKDYFKGFARFHRLIGPESSYYPTASQVRAIATSRLDKDKIAVVIGGNSILYGTGQRADHVWTKELQLLLGDRFRVINLAMRGATAGEFGATAAEVLEKDHKRVILISDLGSSTTFTEPDGSVYPYFYWDAYHKGLLSRDQAREERLQALLPARQKDEKFPELQRRMRLDTWLHFQDAWGAVTYLKVSPQWSPMEARFSSAPRRSYADSDPIIAPANRYSPDADAECMRIVRGWANVAGGTCRANGVSPTNDDKLHPYFSWMAAAAKHCIPEPRRTRTLLLVVRDSPYYVGKLNASEQAAYDDVFHKAVHVLQGVGFATLEVGRNYTLDDFVDRCHLSEQGGSRLADEIAPEVRELAERLGYLKQGESR